MDIRTDLAIELHADAVKELSGKEIDGIKISEQKLSNCSLTEIEITNPHGAKIIGRPIGKYVTVEYGRVGIVQTEKFTAVCDEAEKILSEMLVAKCGKMPKKVLIAGLGNADITADALGPLTLKSILVTGHLKALGKEIFDSFGGVEITAISLGVMAQTGMESAEIIQSIVARTRPQAVIAVDSLASNMLSRLARTLQISDTGIRPGSGIGNARSAIDESFLGVPVISVGVPTMVEIATLVADVSSRMGSGETSAETVRSTMGEEACALVTPKDSAIIISDIAKLIGFAIDRALISDLSYDEIARLVN